MEEILHQLDVLFINSFFLIIIILSRSWFGLCLFVCLLSMINKNTHTCTYNYWKCHTGVTNTCLCNHTGWDDAYTHVTIASDLIHS